MPLEFCECGGLLEPHNGKKRCRTCGKVLDGKINIKITKNTKKNDIPVIEDNRPDLPTTDEKQCSKCGHKITYFWLIQTRSADEPPTQFFRCVKCKHTWREYK
ncbi:transcription factor S [Candidatus Aenigmatarchaeota archaeon]